MPRPSPPDATDTAAQRNALPRHPHPRPARRGLTLAELAAQSELTAGYISQLERNLAYPSIPALFNIARSLGVTIQWFFASEAAVDPADAGYVVRRNTRMSVHYEDGIIDELLTPQPSRQLEILHSRFPPGTYSQQSYSHEGEEAGYILSGIFELWVGDRHFQLREGDSFSYSSQEPHRYGNPGDSDTLVLWVITRRRSETPCRDAGPGEADGRALPAAPEQPRQPRQQPLQGALVVAQHLLSGSGHGRRDLRLRPQAREAVAQLAGIRHLEQRPGVAQLRGDVEEVEQVRTGEHRLAQGRRLQQVVPAVGHQAAADESDVGQGIEEQQLAHGIAEQHLGRACHRLAAGAPDRGEAFAAA